MKNILLLLIGVLISSCASIPNSSITLANEIIKESESMHELNIVLINKLFEERTARVNSFFENKYVPTLLKKYEKLIPASTDYKKELPNIIQSIVPVINRKKDSITSVLKKQNEQIISKLNQNYGNYTKATQSLQNLINSAAKVNKSESDILNSLEKLTGTTKDVGKVENTVGDFFNTISFDLDKIFK